VNALLILAEKPLEHGRKAEVSRCFWRAAPIAANCVFAATMPAAGPGAAIAARRAGVDFSELGPIGRVARSATHGRETGALRPPSRTKKGMKMSLFSKDIKSLDDLFVHTLRDIYYAEQQITQALPKMIDKATSPALKQGFEKHLRETEGHVQRLEQVFELHGVKAKGVDCPAIDGIIEETEEIAGDIDDKQVMDAALIAAAQAVEHYEITRYGTLIAWANELGRSDCASILKKNLEEEKATDKKLTDMAESRVNLQAAE
jgi:ferritin-like metal-binding protein YciE